ncbi:hypothetical protein [Pseudonocardia abyssalis]|uniref:Uncharacterized protein n=1 Tax=Pseudonocardia abyssalis TaxID=2792008 RepID=A0ABS6UU75_9PSEU|nr:hypothetical protein [Pseudonocardia abyssalis]MBW0135777.1 hypothetical protein [Pseudonocardia abyssalis]
MRSPAARRTPPSIVDPDRPDRWEDRSTAREDHRAACTVLVGPMTGGRVPPPEVERRLRNGRPGATGGSALEELYEVEQGHGLPPAVRQSPFVLAGS